MPIIGVSAQEIVVVSRRAAVGSGIGALVRSRVLVGFLGTASLVALWQLAITVGLLAHDAIPGPWLVAASLGSQVTGSALWAAMWHTLYAFLIGIGITAVIAVPLGLLLGSNRWIWLAVRPTVEFLRPVPPLAIIPIVILADGVTLKSKIVLVVFGGVWIVLVQSMYGIRNVDPVTLDTARVFGFGRWRRIWHVVVPSALPYIATGLRIASAIALISTISVELLVGVPGLGSAIATAESGGDMPKMYALIIAAGVLGFSVQAAFSIVERRVLRWSVAHRRPGSAS
jgi:ABC-type nitrate/sulfonate/bicarbonate transport system permease component